jgi:hypothetical protein
VAYLVITLCGMMFGRLWYRCKHTFKFVWFLITLGFVLGYLIGSMYGNKVTLVILFIVGLALSYYMHDRKYIESVEF